MTATAVSGRPSGAIGMAKYGGARCQAPSVRSPFRRWLALSQSWHSRGLLVNPLATRRASLPDTWHLTPSTEMSCLPAPIRILCLGNELLADDAFGSAVAEELRRRFPTMDVVFTTDSGFHLLDNL